MKNSILQREIFDTAVEDIIREAPFKIILPNHWWHSHNSYGIVEGIENQSNENKLNIISFEQHGNESAAVPKPNYWAITQGDYIIKENYKDTVKLRERKKIFYRCALAFAIFANITLMCLLLSLVVTF